MSAVADIGSFAAFAIIVVNPNRDFAHLPPLPPKVGRTYGHQRKPLQQASRFPLIAVSSTFGPTLRSPNSANTTTDNVIAGTSADTHSHHLSSNDSSNTTPLKQLKNIAGIRKPRGLQLLHNNTEGSAHTEKSSAFILQLEQSEEKDAENDDSNNDSDNNENGDGLFPRSNREEQVVHELALLDKQTNNTTAPAAAAAPAIDCVRVADDELAMLPYSSTRYGHASTMETKEEEEAGKSGGQIDAIVSAIVDELCTLVRKPMSMQKPGRERKTSHSQ
ncbi:hypothetical protein H4217_007352 [Coemansia sp. RSA 1939]|nr:hypothetical protein H4217_007352 [Coemansia sp. RSA 1939]